jgi:hypothetical protein
VTAAQSQRGRDREVKIVSALLERGWGAVRAASGAVDVVATASPMSFHPVFGRLVDPANLALRGHCDTFKWLPLYVQVKSTSRPYERFGPADRAELLHLAERGDAAPWLAWWPVRARSVTWIPGSDWPQRGTVTGRTAA